MNKTITVTNLVSPPVGYAHKFWFTNSDGVSSNVAYFTTTPTVSYTPYLQGTLSTSIVLGSIYPNPIGKDTLFSGLTDTDFIYVHGTGFSTDGHYPMVLHIYEGTLSETNPPLVSLEAQRSSQTSTQFRGSTGMPFPKAGTFNVRLQSKAGSQSYNDFPNAITITSVANAPSINSISPNTAPVSSVVPTIKLNIENYTVGGKLYLDDIEVPYTESSAKSVYIENVVLPYSSGGSGPKYSLYYKTPSGSTSDFVYFSSIPSNPIPIPDLSARPDTSANGFAFDSLTPSFMDKDTSTPGYEYPVGNPAFFLKANGEAFSFNQHSLPTIYIWDASIPTIDSSNIHLLQTYTAKSFAGNTDVTNPPYTQWAEFDIPIPFPYVGPKNVVLTNGSGIYREVKTNFFNVSAAPNQPKILSMNPSSGAAGVTVPRIDFEIENYVAGGKIILSYAYVNSEYTPIEVTAGVPDPPTDLKVVNSVKIDGSTCSITLTATQSVSTVTSYKLYYSSLADPVVKATVIPAPTAGSLCTWILPAERLNTTYSFYATCIGTLESTNTATINYDTTVSVAPKVPDTPTNVVAVVGSSPNAVKVTWTAPASANGTLVKYTVTNKQTGATTDVLPTSTLEASFSGLLYGTAYTFGVKVNNEFGDSQEGISQQITLVAPITVPSVPTIVNVTASSGFARLTWAAPTSTGSSAITGYKVILHNSRGLPQPESIVSSSTFETYVSGITDGIEYYFTVASSNASGYGPEAISLVFEPTAGVSGISVVKQSYNYKKFFAAPIDLNKNSDTYNNFLYPDPISVTVPALIINNDVKLPITFSTPRNALSLYFNPSGSTTGTEYHIILNSQYYNDFTALVDELQLTTGAKDLNNNYVYPFEVLSTSSGEGNTLIDTLIFRARISTDKNGFTLVYNNPSIGSPAIIYQNANASIFGETPSIFESYNEVLVDNHIPTPGYDNLHKKALVESQPLVTVKDMNLTLTLDYQDTILNQPRYKVTLPNTVLRPKKVDIFWYNDKNQYTHVIDYKGDGVLFERVKDDSGNFIYNPTNDQVLGYGQINYSKGLITKLYLKDYRKASILGQGIKYPMRINSAGVIKLIANCSELSIPITTTSYPIIFSNPNELATYLNSRTEIINNKLIAGSLNGQLYIVNSQLGPDKTLTISKESSGGYTLQVFGLNPIMVAPPKIYISYSYSLNQTDKNHYIWYQTPHFLLKVKNKTQDSLFTQAHLNYILDKVKKLRPAVTVLDGININIDFTGDQAESTKLVETEDEKIVNIIGSDQHPMVPPYIIVTYMNPVSTLPDETQIGLNDVRVINPDKQEDTLTDGYEYLLVQ